MATALTEAASLVRACRAVPIGFLAQVNLLLANMVPLMGERDDDSLKPYAANCCH
jgi:hypothetical protein